MKELAENKYGHGAINLGVIHRTYRKLVLPRLGMAGEPFDWTKGFDLESSITLLRRDQGTSFSCSGQAGSSFLEAQRKLVGINEIPSAKSIYAPIHYPGGGTTVNALETQIAAHGANLMADVPDSVIESVMEDTSYETDALSLDATKRAGYTPWNIPKNIDAIASAIQSYGGVVVELYGQNNGTWLSPFPQVPSKSVSTEVWSHFIFFKGAQMIEGKKYLAGLNSWGASVGINGVQYFDENYVKFFLEILAFIKDTEIQPIKGNDSIWSAVWQWFMDNIFKTTPKMAV